jgi:hypothetical protein
VIPHLFASHASADDDNKNILESMLNDAVAAPAARGRLVVIGFSERHPLLSHVLRQFRGRAYDSVLYSVHWDNGKDAEVQLDGRIVHPEVALL